ncbi:unnamed protein product [Gadus morhua 'NCC']
MGVLYPNLLASDWSAEHNQDPDSHVWEWVGGLRILVSRLSFTHTRVDSLRTLPTSQMSLSEITPTLFLSGADGSLNQPLLRRKCITLIVNATVTHPCAAYPGVECVRVAVCDLPTARLADHFERVAERITATKRAARWCTVWRA